jgi:hypothetical protein
MIDTLFAIKESRVHSFDAEAGAVIAFLKKKMHG